MNKSERDRQIATSDLPAKELAEQYNVSVSTVYRVKQTAQVAPQALPESFATRALNRRATFGQVAVSGLTRHGGQIQEEFQRELQADKGVKLFEQMSVHPVAAAVLFAIRMAMRAVNWFVEPASADAADEEAAEFLEQCREDMSQTWDEIIDQACTMFIYGFSVAELVYKKRTGLQPGKYTADAGKSRYVDGHIGWRRWQFISPKSLDSGERWDFDDFGRVQGFWQLAAPNYARIYVPMQKALLFRTTVRWDNPEGVSVLRPMYQPWYYAENLSEVEAIAAERMGAGLPVMYLGDGTNRDKTDTNSDWYAAQDMVRNVRTDEQMGLIIPYPKMTAAGVGALFELVSPPSQGLINFSELIDRHEKRMAMTALAQFIFLGMLQVGTQALNASATDTFQMSIGAWADAIAGVVNRYAVPRLFSLNAMRVDELPQIAHSDIGVPDLPALAEYVNKLVGAQVLTPDGELEGHLREMANLPEQSEEIEIVAETAVPSEEEPEEEIPGEEIEEEVEGEEVEVSAAPFESFALKTLKGALAREMTTGKFARGSGAAVSDEDVREADALAFGRMTGGQAARFKQAGLVSGAAGKPRYTDKGKGLARQLRNNPRAGLERMRKLGLVTGHKKGPTVKLKKKGGGGKGKKAQVSSKEMTGGLGKGGMRKEVALGFVKILKADDPSEAMEGMEAKTLDDLRDRGLLADVEGGRAVTEAGKKFFQQLQSGDWEAVHKEMAKQAGSEYKPEEEEEESAHLIDEEFALRLKRGGPKWERSTNTYELAMRSEYDAWAKKTAKTLATADEGDWQAKLRDHIDDLILALIMLGRRNLPDAHALGLGDAASTADGYQELARALQENEDYLTNSLAPDIIAKVQQRINEEPLIRQDQTALAGLLATFLSRVGLYAGTFWGLIQWGVIDRIRQKPETPRVRVVLDPAARHCRDCPGYAGEYDSWEMMVATTGGVPAAWNSECHSNCRCILEEETPSGAWRRVT